MPPELVAVRGSILRQLVAQSSGPSNSADRLKGCRISEILLESEGKDVTKNLMAAAKHLLTLAYSSRDIRRRRPTKPVSST